MTISPFSQTTESITIDLACGAVGINVAQGSSLQS